MISVYLNYPNHCFSKADLTESNIDAPRWGINNGRSFNGLQ